MTTNRIRDLNVIREQEQEFLDMIIYREHCTAVKNGSINDFDPNFDELFDLAAADLIENKYPAEKLISMTPFNYGMIMGKVVILQWALGKDNFDRGLPKVHDLNAIRDREHKLTDILFYQNHTAAVNSSEIEGGYNPIFAGTLNIAEAERIKAKYPVESLGPMGEAEFIVALGELAACRWVLGEAWQVPDCEPHPSKESNEN